MENTTDLFDLPRQKPQKKSASTWYLATNHLNLSYMLSAGLIMPPKGFGKKYYPDSLQLFPGWIPLFADSVPKQVMELPSEEKNFPKPCAASIRLATLRGPVTAFSGNGALRQIQFPDGLEGNETSLLIPAPLPASWIAAILFPSKQDKYAFERDAQETPNVPVSEFKRGVDARLFAKFNKTAWPPISATLSERDALVDIAIAAGGMMGILFQLANRGDEAVKACRMAFDGEESVAAAIDKPMIRAFHDWFASGAVGPSGDMLSKVFWGAINEVAHTRSSEDAHGHRDAVLEYLDRVKTNMDEKAQAALTKLSHELRSIHGFTNSGMSETLERHPKLFSRAMALFFLRDNCADLLELKHPLLTENDYIAAALLFAARDGWIGLSPDIRTQPNLNAAISHRMAAMAHRLAGTDLDLGSPPIRRIPLREVLMPGARAWSAKQKHAALTLARELKWECIHTKISLGKGEYKLLVDGGGTHILIEGDVKAVTAEIDPKVLLQKLAETRIPEKLEKTIRSLL
jgi:hypothetical protein